MRFFFNMKHDSRSVCDRYNTSYCGLLPVSVLYAVIGFIALTRNTSGVILAVISLLTHLIELPPISSLI